MRADETCLWKISTALEEALPPWPQDENDVIFLDNNLGSPTGGVKYPLYDIRFDRYFDFKNLECKTVIDMKGDDPTLKTWDELLLSSTTRFLGVYLDYGIAAGLVSLKPPSCLSPPLNPEKKRIHIFIQPSIYMKYLVSRNEMRIQPPPPPYYAFPFLYLVGRPLEWDDLVDLGTVAATKIKDLIVKPTTRLGKLYVDFGTLLVVPGDFSSFIPLQRYVKLRVSHEVYFRAEIMSLLSVPFGSASEEFAPSERIRAEIRYNIEPLDVTAEMAGGKEFLDVEDFVDLNMGSGPAPLWTKVNMLAQGRFMYTKNPHFLIVNPPLPSIRNPGQRSIKLKVARSVMVLAVNRYIARDSWRYLLDFECSSGVNHSNLRLLRCEHSTI